MSLCKVLRTSTVQRRSTYAVLSSLRSLHATQKGDDTDRSFQFVVCGGGAGGLAEAAGQMALWEGAGSPSA